ncbi:hypothetical protein GGH94_001609 [Coemansia aciculifera]|uniref:Uncharacterized protein n=2 Tax=Coemansia TaxID=4863 RepID=A0A9W8LC38_9FUNG|nr:hypothetical protein GGI19_001531 [Coemansia pectinata]KAJ2866332.1 hypothetical protein GGH94_001609 [Coemansia aciculifera]
MPLLHTRSFATDRYRQVHSEWSCVSCAPQSNCYDGDTWRSLRPRKEFTESQAMGLALVLAEQYVRESQEEEECDGFSLVGWSHVEHSPSAARGQIDLESKRRQEFLSLPMRSTRSRDVRMQQRLASNGSTVCELEPRDSTGKAVKTGGKHRNLLKRPVKWIRGIVSSLS